jgi:hypothetical protein
MEEIRFTLSVTGPDPDDLDESYDAAASLRADLEEISDIRVSEVLTNQGQEGTRSGIVTQVLTDGGIGLVIFYYGGTMLRGISQDIVKAIQNWHARNKGKQVILKDADGNSIELHALSGKETLSVLETLKAKQQHHVIEDE